MKSSREQQWKNVRFKKQKQVRSNLEIRELICDKLINMWCARNTLWTV